MKEYWGWILLAKLKNLLIYSSRYTLLTSFHTTLLLPDIGCQHLPQAPLTHSGSLITGITLQGSVSDLYYSHMQVGSGTFCLHPFMHGIAIPEYGPRDQQRAVMQHSEESQTQSWEWFDHSTRMAGSCHKTHGLRGAPIFRILSRKKKLVYEHQKLCWYAYRITR